MNECCNISDLISEFSTQLEGYLVKRTQDTNLSKDILQEVMVKVINAHQKNERVDNLRAWIYQVTKNTLADHYRKLSPITNFIPESEQEYSGSNEPEIYFIIDTYLKPMINLLPEKYRSFLIMSDLENIPQKEIASQTGLSLTATKARIQRARKQLHALFYTCCEVELDAKGRFVTCTPKDCCLQLKKLR